MADILIPGSLPRATVRTIEELLWEFEEEFNFQQACMQIDSNPEIGKLIEKLRDNPRISSQERDFILRTAVLVFSAIQRQGQILNPDYCLPQVSQFTMRNTLKEANKIPDLYPQIALKDMSEESPDLFYYLKQQFAYGRARYMNNFAERLSAVIYSALRDQERKRGLGELSNNYKHLNIFRTFCQI